MRGFANYHDETALVVILDVLFSTPVGPWLVFNNYEINLNKVIEECQVVLMYYHGVGLHCQITDYPKSLSC
jgi:hypothetical protein